MPIKWGFYCCLPMKTLLHTQGIFLHTISILLHTDRKFLHTGTYIVTALACKWGRKASHDYRPQINKAFEVISCFTYRFILLSGYAIKWGFNSYRPAEILLHTQGIKLHTDRKLLRTGKLFFSLFPLTLELPENKAFRDFKNISLENFECIFSMLNLIKPFKNNIFQNFNAFTHWK